MHPAGPRTRGSRKELTVRRKCKAALAAAAAALALCALPFAAQAGSWGGAVLSKGLVYEDVYGVVNGNAQMAKTVR